MAIEIKTLGAGLVKLSSATQPLVFKPLEGILYAAPHPAELFGATVKKAALVAKMLFYNHNPSSVTTPVTINIFFVRYSSLTGVNRPRRRIMPVNLTLASGQVVTDEIPLTLQEGDAILGDASQLNVIDYVINGFERTVI